MADENQLFGLDRPAGASATPAKENQEIHVIPDEFYGAQAKHRPVLVKPELQPAGSPVSVASDTAAKPAESEPKKKNVMVIIVILIIILSLLGGAAYYFLVFSKRTVKCGDGTCSPTENHNSCPQDCEPSPAVCGDGTCETPENHISCPKDCEPPPPECGDGACDVEESFETCPKDCEPPPVQCGDGKCEENRGETYKDCPSDCVPPPPGQASDKDSDGLTDAEETEIFGSDPNKVNSDGDSYVDLNEVLNLFDPSKPVPAQLIDNPGIALYRNEIFGVELLRPAAWGVRDVPTERTVRFTSPTGENVRLTIYNKPADVSLMDWLQNAPIEGASSLTSVERLLNKKGYEQIITSDRRTIFVANNGVVVGFTYELADQLEIRYRVTLSMMANSLEFISEPQNTSTEEPTDSTSLPLSNVSGSMAEHQNDLEG
ncbi:MAG: hypothetical protein V1738_05620 [Patescibacteria group bacterium]